MLGIRRSRGARALAIALVGTIIPTAAMADSDSTQASNSSGQVVTSVNIFNPTAAPVIRLKVTAALIPQVAQRSGSTVISSSAIENKPGLTNFTQVIAATVPGTAAAATGEIHIRGSHGQYSYYLDGAPLPADVTGSFSDLINPKNIETLRVYTGGFPAEYGGQLAAIFDVTAKAGEVGPPSGFVQQLAETYNNFESTGQVGGSSKDVSYFVSGIRQSTGSDISPVSETPLHDAGNQSVGFSKIDYQSGPDDRITLDTTVNSADLLIPNTPRQQSIGVNDSQQESGNVANLIWRRIHGGATSRLVLYSHESHLKYNGSPQDLLSEPGGSPLDPNSVGLARTNEDQTATYYGMRFDQTTTAGRSDELQFGFDADYARVAENFLVTSIVNSDANPDGPVSPAYSLAGELGNIYGGDRSVYLQDDWNHGRAHLNYGMRYDQHDADTTTSQVSPRINLEYTGGRKDSFRLYYDRLFQPASIEDVKNLAQAADTGGATAQQVALFQPERDDFYQGGWSHQFERSSVGFDAYYRNEFNTIDDDVIGSSQVDVPVNFKKGYARGLELTYDGDLNKETSYYANVARSWAQETGPITGGLDYGTSTPGYIFDDHDETTNASFGLNFDNAGSFASLDGEYGSGFPYFGGDNLDQLLWTHPHMTLDIGGGTKLGFGELELTIDNIFNHAFVIKQAGPFTNIQWSLGRVYGVKYTLNF